jgi:hypothetical protein
MAPITSLAEVDDVQQRLAAIESKVAENQPKAISHHG